MRVFAITIIPHHGCTILSLILFKTTRPRAYLLPHWKLKIVKSMSPNESSDVPNTIGCKIPLGTVCYRQLQSDGAISNRRVINHSNFV